MVHLGPKRSLSRFSVQHLPSTWPQMDFVPGAGSTQFPWSLRKAWMVSRGKVHWRGSYAIATLPTKTTPTVPFCVFSLWKVWSVSFNPTRTVLATRPTLPNPGLDCVSGGHSRQVHSTLITGRLAQPVPQVLSKHCYPAAHTVAVLNILLYMGRISHCFVGQS
mgnify:CR=1 FL=1